MRDPEVSLGRVIACGAWVLGVALLTTAWLADLPFLGMAGVLVSSAAATATTRSYFVDFTRMVRTAFELGQDSVRPMSRTR